MAKTERLGGGRSEKEEDLVLRPAKPGGNRGAGPGSTGVLAPRMMMMRWGILGGLNRNSIGGSDPTRFSP